MQLFDLVDTNPQWKPEIDFKYPLEVLRVRRIPLTYYAAVFLDGQWRSTRWMDFQCFPCYRTTMRHVPLVYVGWKREDSLRTFYRSICPVCKNESNTMHVGWRPPTPNQ